jgi:hypothetical protein
MLIRANSKSDQNTQTESIYRTLSGADGLCLAPTGLCSAQPKPDYFNPRVSTGLCLVQPDIVRPYPDIVRSSKSSQRVDTFELSIYIPTPPMARISWPVEITVL